MVKRLGWALIALTLFASAVLADEQKCLVRQPGGGIEIRHIDIADDRQATATLQRYLDVHEAPSQTVEACIDPGRRFESTKARDMDANSPR